MIWTILDFLLPRTVHEGVMTSEIAHVNAGIVTHETSSMTLDTGGKGIVHATDVLPWMTLRSTRMS